MKAHEARKPALESKYGETNELHVSTSQERKVALLRFGDLDGGAEVRYSKLDPVDAARMATQLLDWSFAVAPVIRMHHPYELKARGDTWWPS